MAGSKSQNRLDRYCNFYFAEECDLHVNYNTVTNMKNLYIISLGVEKGHNCTELGNEQSTIITFYVRVAYTNFFEATYMQGVWIWKVLTGKPRFSSS